LFFPISSMLRIVVNQTANINNKKPISSHIIISTYRIWPRSLCPLGHYSLAASVGLEPHIFSGWKARRINPSWPKQSCRCICYSTILSHKRHPFTKI
jgi:hypothetical protein